MKMFKFLLVAAGLLCAGLGTVGIFLPGLPTVPFYLLATFCFAKSSLRFHCWFTGTKLYKKHLESFSNSRSMTLKSKFAILVPVSIMLIMAIVMVNVHIVRIIIAVLLLTKYWYFIFMIKTIKRVDIVDITVDINETQK